MNRIIGSYDKGNEGPLLIIFGAMHGNEPAGVDAINYLLKMLEVEPIRNKSFNFRGKILGLIGNLQAFKVDQRYLHKDLNRQWKIENVNTILASHSDFLESEDLEMYQLVHLIRKEVENYKPQELIVLDLHTTSSFGGIFTIPSYSDKSFKLAKQMHAPVVKGFLEGIFGTTLHYFNSDNFNVETTALTFESGQHREDLAVNRAIAAMINLMRTLNMVDEDAVESYHDELLINYSKSLPKVCELVCRHPITPEDHFEMLPNFENFQPVEENQQLAIDKNGPILAPQSSRILMPLYQSKGEDGFFLIKELDDA